MEIQLKSLLVRVIISDSLELAGFELQGADCILHKNKYRSNFLSADSSPGVSFKLTIRFISNWRGRPKCTNVLTLSASINLHSQCDETIPRLGMNPDEARNNRWVQNVTHFCISVSIAWKYLKAKHIIAFSSEHFFTYQSLFLLFSLPYY